MSPNCIFITLLEIIFQFIAFSVVLTFELQQLRNPCWTSGCSHLCETNEHNQPVCHCPENFTLADDRKNCVENKKQTLCTEFECVDKLLCISYLFVCDGHPDCEDKSDESHCNHECQEQEIRCNSGECIARSMKCDGFVDCKAESDEIDCPKGCANNLFDCRDDECVLMSVRCDGNDDCKNGFDEKNCFLCGNDTTHWECRTGSCIPRLWQCDRHNDCPDGSDEEKCFPVCDHFCDNGVCINKSAVCDGSVQCADGSDEIGCLTPPTPEPAKSPMDLTDPTEPNTDAEKSNPQLQATEIGWNLARGSILFLLILAAICTYKYPIFTI